MGDAPFKHNTMKIKQFFRDMLREDQEGKFSSKKAWGHVIMIAVVASYVLDGLHFYVINETLFGYMLIAGCTLIGLKGLENLLAKWKGTSPIAEKPTKPAKDE